MDSSSKKFLDDDSIEKKFIGAKNTQDCIQSVAIWALTNKNQHDQIVSIWLNSIKKSKVSRRLTLFYICNEIVQTCRRKHALIFKDAFKEVLKDATLLVRDKTVSDGIERMFNIWKERDIFEEDFIVELLKILKDSNIETSTTKLLSDFKLNEFTERILNISQLDEEIQVKTKKIQNINVDSLNLNYTKLLKDRQHGFIYTKQVEEFQKQMSDFVVKSEQLRKSKEEFINDLDFCSLYYEAQYGEARIVANAYRSFGNRIRSIQKKLEEIRRTLPDPLSPLPSPSYDAPSPPDSINDCMSPLSDHPPLPDQPPSFEDITEPVDMEFSDDEGAHSTQALNNMEQTSKNNSVTPVNFISYVPKSISSQQSIADISNIPPLSYKQLSSSNPNGIHAASFNISMLNSNIRTVANFNSIAECKNMSTNIKWDKARGLNTNNFTERKKKKVPTATLR